MYCVPLFFLVRWFAFLLTQTASHYCKGLPRPTVVFIQMICRPQWPTTKRVIGSSLIFIPVAVAYTVLLAFSWEPDTLALILPGSLQDGLSGEEVP